MLVGSGLVRSYSYGASFLFPFGSGPELQEAVALHYTISRLDGGTTWPAFAMARSVLHSVIHKQVVDDSDPSGEDCHDTVVRIQPTEAAIVSKAMG